MSKLVIGIVLVAATVTGGLGAAWLSLSSRAADEFAALSASVKASLGPLGAVSYESASFDPLHRRALLRNVSLFRPGFAATAEEISLSGLESAVAKNLKVVADSWSFEAPVASMSGIAVTAGIFAGVKDIRLERPAAEISSGALKLRPTAAWVTISDFGRAEPGVSLYGATVPLSFGGLAYTLRTRQVDLSKIGGGSPSAAILGAVIAGPDAANFIEIASLQGGLAPTTGVLTASGTGVSVRFTSNRVREALSTIGYGLEYKGDISVKGSMNAASDHLVISEASFKIADTGKLSLSAEFMRRNAGDPFGAWEVSQPLLRWTDSAALQAAIGRKSVSSRIPAEEMRGRMWDWCFRPPAGVARLPIREAVRRAFGGPVTFELQLHPGPTVSAALGAMMQTSTAGGEGFGLDKPASDTSSLEKP